MAENTTDTEVTRSSSRLETISVRNTMQTMYRDTKPHTALATSGFRVRPPSFRGTTERGWISRLSSRRPCLETRYTRTILKPPVVEPAQPPRPEIRIISSGSVPGQR